MAVDANVLIYERIREEVRSGRSAIAALDAGFREALATIIDCQHDHADRRRRAVLPRLRPGAGFAVTLSLGIVTTLFTAFTVTRLIVASWVRWARPAQSADLSCEPDRHAPSAHRSRPTPSCRFMRMAARSASRSSAVLSIVSLVLFLTVGLNFGIDFIGGTVIEVQSKTGPADIGAIRSKLDEARTRRSPGPGVRRRRPTCLIRIADQQPGGEAAQQAVVSQGQAALGDEVEYRRVEVVGPQVSRELVQRRHHRL